MKATMNILFFLLLSMPPSIANAQTTLAKPPTDERDRPDAKNKLEAINEYLRRKDGEIVMPNTLTLFAIVQMSGKPARIMRLNAVPIPKQSQTVKFSHTSGDVRIDMDAEIQVEKDRATISGTVEICFDSGPSPEEPTNSRTTQRFLHRLKQNQTALFRGIGTATDRISIALVRT